VQATRQQDEHLMPYWPAGKVRCEFAIDLQRLPVIAFPFLIANYQLALLLWPHREQRAVACGNDIDFIGRA
jgi:hypothetical protein